MQKKKKKTRLFIFLIICFVLVPFLLTKGCNYMESLNQAKNSVSEPISSISEQIQTSARVYTHAHTPARTHSRPHNAGAYAHERAHTRVYNEHVYAQSHSISKANWTGTAVPDSGYIENVYFNTNLSFTDVISLFNNLTTAVFENRDTYPVLITINSTQALQEGILFYNDNNFGITIMCTKKTLDTTYSTIPIFVEDKNDVLNIKGWTFGNTELNPLTESFITFNSNAITNTILSQFSLENQNDILSNLFSITPFKQSSSNELSIGNLFAQLGNAVIIFGSAIVNVFVSLEPIFWNEGPTLIFILLIASVSFALVFWGIELLISLIGVFKTKRKKKK